MNNSWSDEDQLKIDDFEVACRIGDTAEEQAFPQIVLVSVDMLVPLKIAGRSDQLKDSVDYASILRQIKSIAERKTFNLVEAFAEAVATKVLEDSRVRATRVRAAKKVFPGLKSFSVQIVRKRK